MRLEPSIEEARKQSCREREVSGSSRLRSLPAKMLCQSLQRSFALQEQSTARLVASRMSYGILDASSRGQQERIWGPIPSHRFAREIMHEREPVAC